MSRRRTGGKPRDKHPPAPTAGATLAAADPVAAAQLPPRALADAGIGADRVDRVLWDN